MTLELFEQGPGVYVPILMISLVITLIAYSAFPLLYAQLRKAPITAKQFKRRCYGINVIPMLFFFLFSAKPSPWAYALWTSIFISVGIKKLEQRGLIVDEEADADSNQDVELQNSLQQPATAIPSRSEKQKAQNRFCKYCGCPIDSATKKCTGCGKQFFKLPTVKRSVLGKVCVVLLCVALLGFMIWCGYLNEVNKQLSLQLADQSSSIQSLEKTLEENSKTIETLNQKLSAAKKSLKQLQIDYDDLESKADDIREKVRFYDRYVVFVLEEKPGLYHKYGCPYIKYLSYSFYVYDIDVAKQLGYTQCTMCD